MKLEEVLPALREGKKIRRTFWWEEHYFKLTNDGIVDQEGKNFTIGKDDLCCLDWEIVEVKKKKVKLRDLTEEQFKKWLKYNCYKVLCVGCIFFKTPCDYGRSNCWVRNKDLYSDKFLDQEIEIDE